MDSSSFRNASEDIARVSLAILNYFLALRILSEIGLSGTYMEIGAVALGALSVVGYFIISPSLLLIYFAQAVVTRGIPSDLKGFIGLTSFLILLFLIPVIDLIRSDRGKSILTAVSTLLDLVMPIFVISVPLGISLKKETRNQVLAFLPLLYLFLQFQGTPLRFIEFLVLMAISAYLFSVSGLISLTGGIPTALAIFFLTSSPVYALIAAALSIMSNLAKTLQEASSVRRRQIEGLNQYRNGLMNRMNLVRNVVGKVSQVGSIPEVRNDLSALEELFRNALQCTNIECLKNNENKLNEISLSIKQKINDYIFRRVTKLNETAQRLKLLGISVDSAEYAGELELGQDMVITINQLNGFEENLYEVAGRFYKKLSVSLRETLGWDLQELSSDSDQVSQMGKIVNEALPKLDICEDTATKLVSELPILSQEDSERVTNMHLEYRTLKAGLDRVTKAHEIVKKVYEGTESFLRTAKSKYLEYSGLGSGLFKGAEDLGLLTSAMQKEKGYCAKLNLATLTMRLSLQKVVEDYQIIQGLKDVGELVDSMRDEIISRLREEGCIKVSEIGLDDKYAAYVGVMLNAKGDPVNVSGSQICLVKSR